MTPPLPGWLAAAAWALAAGLPAAAPAPGTLAPPVTMTASAAPQAPGLLTRTAALLSACLDDYNRLDFERSEAEAFDAMALQPEHPLPLVHLLGCLVAEAYEQSRAGRIDRGLLRCFGSAAAQARTVETAWEAAHHDAWSQLYIGNTFGAEALLALYQHHPIRAYELGRHANAALLKSQQRLPGLPDADLGLGQYDYYCGRQNALLRFLLHLPGDIPGGIARLEACADSGCRSAELAQMALAQVLVEEEPDPRAALPYVLETFRRYPFNWSVAKTAMEEALALGPGDPQARALALALRRQWDSGWRPPAYARMDPAPLWKAMGMQP